MKNQCVALLLLACLVTAHGWKWEDIGMRGKRKTPQQCYEYCYKASIFPHVIKDPLCRKGCQYIPMWEGKYYHFFHVYIIYKMHTLVFYSTLYKLISNYQMDYLYLFTKILIIVKLGTINYWGKKLYLFMG